MRLNNLEFVSNANSLNLQDAVDVGEWNIFKENGKYERINILPSVYPYVKRNNLRRSESWTVRS